MKIKAGEMRTEAAPQASRGLAAFTQAAKRFKCTHTLSTQASVFTSIKKLPWCYFEFSVISKEAFMEVLIDLLYIYFSIYMITVNELLITVV